MNQKENEAFTRGIVIAASIARDHNRDWGLVRRILKEGRVSEEDAFEAGCTDYDMLVFTDDPERTT